MKIAFTKNAKKDVESLDYATKKRIVTKLKWYMKQEYPLVFAEKLTDSRLGDYRYRIGEYRVIFEVIHDIVHVNKIGHRRDIYR